MYLEISKILKLESNIAGFFRILSLIGILSLTGILAAIDSKSWPTKDRFIHLVFLTIHPYVWWASFPLSWARIRELIFYGSGGSEFDIWWIWYQHGSTISGMVATTSDVWFVPHQSYPVFIGIPSRFNSISHNIPNAWVPWIGLDICCRLLYPNVRNPNDDAKWDLCNLTHWWLMVVSCIPTGNHCNTHS